MHSGWKGIFEYFQYCFLVARIKHYDITRYLRSNKVEIVEFQDRKMNFLWQIFDFFCQIYLIKWTFFGKKREAYDPYPKEDY